MAIFELNATVRNDQGKGASRRLRHEGKVPAILYGAEQAPVSLAFEHHKVLQAQEHEAFYSHVLTLNNDGQPVKALIKDIQRHPVKPVIMHMDFLRVDESHFVHTKVPVHFTNEATAAAVKAGGVVAHHINEVEVSCLPAALPEFIEVSLADVEVGQTVHLSDIKLPAGVELVELKKGADHDQAVVSINAPKGGAADAAE